MCMLNPATTEIATARDRAIRALMAGNSLDAAGAQADLACAVYCNTSHANPSPDFWNFWARFETDGNTIDETCTTCQGKGTLIVEYPARGNDVIQVEETCWSCGGDGIAVIEPDDIDDIPDDWESSLAATQYARYVAW